VYRAAGLPRCSGDLRPHRLDRHVRTCGSYQLPDLHAGDQPMPEGWRIVFVAHHRRQHVGSLRRPLDCKIYFSQFDAAVGPADYIRCRRPFRFGRLAQFRSALRSHPNGLASELRRKLALYPGCLRPAVSTHVDILPAFLRRQFPCEAEPALADRFFQKRGQGWLSFHPLARIKIKANLGKAKDIGEKQQIGTGLICCVSSNSF
jgi:hypothetical protein